VALLNTKSLAATIDSVNDALFFGGSIATAERLKVARWLASRRGARNSYSGLPAPTDADICSNVRVFTGEETRSGAATCHILGEEALRLMLFLGARDAVVRQAIERASASMLNRIAEPDRGYYCCGRCSAALWRAITAGGYDNHEARLASGLRSLNKARDGKGRWGRFPFYYTLLALSDVDTPAAIAEMRYAAPVLERMRAGRDRYSLRRRRLAEIILWRC
jgi:hypothetical protein